MWLIFVEVHISYWCTEVTRRVVAKSLEWNLILLRKEVVTDTISVQHPVKQYIEGF